jgi:hypothetical protein
MYGSIKIRGAREGSRDALRVAGPTTESAFEKPFSNALLAFVEASTS